MQLSPSRFSTAFADEMAALFTAAMFAFSETLASGPRTAFKNAFGRTRRGQVTGVDSLVPLALAIVSVAIVVGVGTIVLAEMEGAVDNNNSTSVLNTAIDALGTFADFFVVIVIIGIAAVIFILLRVVRGAGRSAGV